MAKKRCRRCRQKFERSTLNENHLCSRCAPAVLGEGGELSKLLGEDDGLDKLKKIGEKLERCDKILGFAWQLVEYEKNTGKQLMNKPASAYADRFEQLKHSMIDDRISAVLNEGAQSIESAINRKAKEIYFAKMRYQLIELGGLAEKYEIEMSSERKSIIDQARLREAVENGNTATFEGNSEKALAYYREGLEQLSQEGVSKTLKAEGLELLQKKIKKLEGKE